jgi:hypothetical protein
MSYKLRYQRSLRYVLIYATFFAATITLVAPARAAAQVWFSVIDPNWRNIREWPPNDSMQLFQPDAPWQTAAHGVAVYEIFKKFVEQGSDDDLRTIIDGLRQRHIALAIQGTPLMASQTCGLGIEGYGPPHDMAKIAMRVKQLGGTIDYVAMDEPLYYGHAFQGRPLKNYETHAPTPCHSEIAVLAQEAAAKMAEFRAIFPNAKIGDVEPIGSYPPGFNLASDLSTWFAAYKAASGMPLAFVQFDVVWARPFWQEQFGGAVAAVRKAGLPLGIIYNASPTDPTDANWVADAKGHIQLIESMLHGQPNQAKFQSWTDRPRKILPETAPDSFTSLVKYYVERR